MASTSQPSGGFSLFPSASASQTPPRKTPTPRPRAGTPQSLQGRGPSLDMSAPPPPRKDSPVQEDLAEYVIDGTPPMGEQSPLATNNPFYQSHHGASIPPPPQQQQQSSRTAQAIPGNNVRSSIAKPPLEDSPVLIRQAGINQSSIFPQYDHTLPFDQQHYYPTQTSPTHIPRTVISRQSHIPPQVESRSPPVVRSPVRSPMSAGSAQQRWPRRQYQPTVIPPVSTTEELREYWKTANGWRASSMEGRTYCMRMIPEKDTPIYTLTSRTQQPFYHMRIDPTSASAYVTLSRHDPAKPMKHQSPKESSARSSQGGLLNSIREAEGKSQGWQEALATTLEEPSRWQRPNDGLVALLYPTPASKVALERPHDASAVAAAENECARLVWDEDSANYFLSHPAVATPFCITIERSPAYSRTEYTIEHVESPQHLGRLTRDGTGEGWIELDTLVAGRIESYYALDVAAAALLLVAHIDEKNVLVEQFAPPPAAHLSSSRASSRFSFINPPSEHKRSGSGLSKSKSGKLGKKKSKSRLEELELDLESQASSLGGKLEIKESDKEKLPGTARTIIKLIGFAFKCVIWALTLGFKALLAIVVGLSKCITSDKL
ncbi:hypothetical protein F5Y16DRAFT_77189 [Xylariaceae sp. FL0255]|nr:hypothetical protein F5Y16DRAFT_77189 [Xylariaceae sp. FL0255]